MNVAVLVKNMRCSIKNCAKYIFYLFFSFLLFWSVIYNKNCKVSDFLKVSRIVYIFVFLIFVFQLKVRSKNQIHYLQFFWWSWVFGQKWRYWNVLKSRKISRFFFRQQKVLSNWIYSIAFTIWTGNNQRPLQKLLNEWICIWPYSKTHNCDYHAAAFSLWNQTWYYMPWSLVILYMTTEYCTAYMMQFIQSFHLFYFDLRICVRVQFVVLAKKSNFWFYIINQFFF